MFERISLPAFCWDFEASHLLCFHLACLSVYLPVCLSVTFPNFRMCCLIRTSVFCVFCCCCLFVLSSFFSFFSFFFFFSNRLCISMKFRFEAICVFERIGLRVFRWDFEASHSLCLSRSLSSVSVYLSPPGMTAADITACLCVSLSVSLCLRLSVFVSLSVCLSLCVSVCLSVSLCLYLSLYASVCLFFGSLSICLSVSLSACLSLCICLSPALSFFFPPSLSPPPPHPLPLCVCVSSACFFPGRNIHQLLPVSRVNR